jgi:CheY-like chemotaxis protein
MAKFFHILLVDDDPDDHQFFREALRGLKIGNHIANEVVNVSSVYNGVQAMEYLLKGGVYATAAEPVPDFVVLDLNMPGMDGFEVLKQIRKKPEFAMLPVYVLTTSRDVKHKSACKELGCTGFFSKPPKKEELRVVISKMINSEPDF